MTVFLIILRCSTKIALLYIHISHRPRSPSSQKSIAIERFPQTKEKTGLISHRRIVYSSWNKEGSIQSFSLHFREEKTVTNTITNKNRWGLPLKKQVSSRQTHSFALHITLWSGRTRLFYLSVSHLRMPTAVSGVDLYYRLKQICIYLDFDRYRRGHSCNFSHGHAGRSVYCASLH